ncbi:MAG: YceI family protein [Flavobacteriales bacterium]
MKAFILGLSTLICFQFSDAQIVEFSESETKFYSYTLIEDIEAVSDKASGLISLDQQEFYFEVPIMSFDFEKDLMEEHFNENYMESEEYPTASFEGKTTSQINLDSNDTYTFSGTLTIHGVAKKRDITVRLTKNDEREIELNSSFKVKLVDHKIKIPKVVFANIAEVIDVSIKGKMVLSKN